MMGTRDVMQSCRFCKSTGEFEKLLLRYCLATRNVLVATMPTTVMLFQGGRLPLDGRRCKL